MISAFFTTAGMEPKTIWMTTLPAALPPVAAYPAAHLFPIALRASLRIPAARFPLVANLRTAAFQTRASLKAALAAADRRTAVALKAQKAAVKAASPIHRGAHFPAARQPQEQNWFV